MRQVTQNTKVPEEGALVANWEGPYKVIRVLSQMITSYSIRMAEKLKSREMLRF